MIRCRVALVVVGLAVVLLPGRAAAQYNPYFPQSYGSQFGGGYGQQFGGFGSQIQPGLSPYLNILRGNSAVNYLGATRGDILSFQQGMLNNQFGTSLLDLQRRQAQGGLPGEELPLLPGTGHVTAFGYYYPYYNINPLQRVAPQQQVAPQTSGGQRRSTKQ
jgi:hypothetical protein